MLKGILTFLLILAIAFAPTSRALAAPVQLLKANVSPSGSIEERLRSSFKDDKIKIEAIANALTRAKKFQLTDLNKGNNKIQLYEILIKAKNEVDKYGDISQETTKILENNFGIHKNSIKNKKGLTVGWNLSISKKSLKQLNINDAATLASTGYLFIEAYHQLRNLAGYEQEKSILIAAIEKSAKEIVRYPDENNDNRYGWGRIWFKGNENLILHTTLPGQNLNFGGYTYFPRADQAGSPCEKSLPLKEEAFDHAHNVIFLLETFLVTRDRELAEKILYTVGKSFDDTFQDGDEYGPLGENGWYYWKQLGGRSQGKQDKCEVGREIKNTNLRMGLALYAYAQILARNSDELKANSLLSFNPDKYLNRAKQIINTNNYEIFDNNNFGYQGAQSREIEQIQEPSKVLVYDRTQVSINLENPALNSLKTIIVDGNKFKKRSDPEKVILCGGADSKKKDSGLAGSCWHHLAFEAEDYYRIIRFSNLLGQENSKDVTVYLDALTRNIAAASVMIDNKNSTYKDFFPETAESDVSGKFMNSTFYGFFCMAKNIHNQKVVNTLPKSYERFLGSLAAVCNSVPEESRKTGVTWRKGYKFYELYLAADRALIEKEDFELKNKKLPMKG